jgi:ABC-type Fe3+-hydroxamate transport system substrate-binding protein
MRRANDNETPEERFKRIATLRTNAVLDKIRILGKLANKQRYGYTEKDVNKIFAAINRQLRQARAKFSSQKREKFRL